MRIIKMGSDPGQTLVEVLVAIGIVVVALVGILSASLSYLTTGRQSAERTAAIFLAREGAEVAYAIRSSQWLNPLKIWPYGLNNGNWIADCNAINFADNWNDSHSAAADNLSINQCENCRLYLDSNGRYTHVSNGNVQTSFRRMITISTGDDLGEVCPNSGEGCEKKVEVKVYWTEGGRAHQITLEDRLTNWR